MILFQTFLILLFDLCSNYYNDSYTQTNKLLESFGLYSSWFNVIILSIVLDLRSSKILILVKTHCKGLIVANKVGLIHKKLKGGKAYIFNKQIIYITIKLNFFYFITLVPCWLLKLQILYITLVDLILFLLLFLLNLQFPFSLSLFAVAKIKLMAHWIAHLKLLKCKKYLLIKIKPFILL